MKVKIIRNTVANKVAVFEGEVHDLADGEAKYLIAIGKAEKVVEQAKSEDSKPEVSEPEDDKPAEIETADRKVTTEKAVKPGVKK